MRWNSGKSPDILSKFSDVLNLRISESRSQEPGCTELGLSKLQYFSRQGQQRNAKYFEQGSGNACILSNS